MAASCLVVDGADLECHTPVVLLRLRSTKGKQMAIFEFSDGFDAVGWYTEQMGKGHNFESHEDPYGWDEPAEYPL
jgi:hypothetical protein